MSSSADLNVVVDCAQSTLVKYEETLDSLEDLDGNVVKDSYVVKVLYEDALAKEFVMGMLYKNKRAKEGSDSDTEKELDDVSERRTLLTLSAEPVGKLDTDYDLGTLRVLAKNIGENYNRLCNLLILVKQNYTGELTHEDKDLITVYGNRTWLEGDDRQTPYIRVRATTFFGELPEQLLVPQKSDIFREALGMSKTS